MCKSAHQFFILSTFLLFLILISCTEKVENIVEKMIIAHNENNVEEEISFFAQDATYGTAGSQRKKDEGIGEIKKHLEWDAAINSIYIASNYKISGDTVVCQIKEITDWATLLGIDTVYFDYMQVIFENGYIKSLHMKPEKLSGENYKNMVNTLMMWAQDERPELVEELKVEGEFVASKETAPKWIKLATEWQKSIEN